MLIVVEGVDGSGKSTFVSDLSHMMPDNTWHLHKGPIQRHPLAEYVDDLMAYNPGKDNVAADRWHVGEMVYGPLYRGESKVTSVLDRYITMFLESRGAELLWMDTPFDLVMERLTKRGEDFLQPQHVRLVHQFYEEYCPSHGWIPVKETYHPQKTVEKIIRQAERRQIAAESIAGRMPSYVGSLQPEILFVLPQGDTEPGAAQRSSSPLSGFPYPNSTGSILLHSLEMLGARQRIAFVNWDDYAPMLSCPLTVTVGIRAHKYLKNFPHTSLASPHDINQIRMYGPRAYTKFLQGVV